jgi:hypothetical protein
MKRLVFLLLVTTQVALGQIQDSTAVVPFPSKNRFKYGLFLEVSYSNALTSLPTIRSFFQESQVQADSRFNNFIGTGIGYRRNRLKTMVRFDYGIDYRALPSSERITLPFVARRQNVGNFDLSLGYDVVNTRNSRLYLNAGIGRLRYEYTIYRLTNQVVSFKDVLQNGPPGNIPSLILDNGYWDINIESAQREKQRQGLQLMLRLGYRRGFRASTWTSDAYQIAGGPADRIGQFYFQVGAHYSRNYNKRSKR